MAWLPKRKPVERPRIERSEDAKTWARLYGLTAWSRARAAYLAAHPFCVDPDGRHGKRVVLAQCVDHIKPHRGDRALFFDSDNWQGLCHSCHARKTASEDGGFGNEHRARTVVVIICGPPGSGKSTYVERHKSAGDIVIDHDALLAAVTGRDPHDRSASEAEIYLASAAFDGLVERLSRKDLDVRAWVIASLPDHLRREQMQRRLGAQLVLLAVPPEECKRRVAERTSQDVWHRAIDDWWRVYRRSTGTAGTARGAIDGDRG